MEINKAALGKMIKNIRVAEKDTLESFAEKINIRTNGVVKSGKSNVSRWEKGENVPSDITLKAIAEIGKVTVDELLYGDKESYLMKSINEKLTRNLKYWKENSSLDLYNYVQKYHSRLVDSILQDFHSFMFTENSSYEDIDRFVEYKIGEFIINSYTSTDDLLNITIDELEKMIKDTKILIGEISTEQNKKVDEIDHDIANKMISYLQETIKKIECLKK